MISYDFISLIIKEKLKKVFLKIDIEGSEYLILDELIELSHLIDGLVIEFHDIENHLEIIQRFVERTPLNICHIHCNNHGRVNANNLPDSIECSFTAQPAISSGSCPPCL